MGSGQIPATTADLEAMSGEQQQEQQQEPLRYRDALAWEQQVLLEDSQRLLDLAGAHLAAQDASAASATDTQVSTEPTTASRSDSSAQHQPSGRPGWEQFFSLYVHNEMGHSFPENSLFYGREVAGRVNTTQGYAQHILLQVRCLLLPAPACSCLLLPAPACSCLLLPAPACSCLLLPAPGWSCLLLDGWMARSACCCVARPLPSSCCM